MRKNSLKPIVSSMFALILKMVVAASLLVVQIESANNTTKHDSLPYPYHPPPHPLPPHIPHPKPAPNPYPQPTPAEKPCEICSKLDSGFDASDNRLKSLVTKAENVLQTSVECDPVSSNVKVVISEPTGLSDNANEIAFCPLNYILVNCRCSKEDYSCDGVTVTAEGRGCKVRNGPGGSPVKAIAMCVPEDAGFTITPTTDPSSNPTISCNPDEFVVDCWLENALPEFGFIRTVISNDRTTCTTSGTCGAGSYGCKLTALCYSL